jgi:hypothetical protein
MRLPFRKACPPFSHQPERPGVSNTGLIRIFQDYARLGEKRALINSEFYLMLQIPQKRPKVEVKINTL